MSLASTILARSGLEAFWKMGETSGTSMADSKGSNTGTYSGGFTLNESGALVPSGDNSPSVLFDGSSGQASVPNSSSLDPTSGLTLSAIVYPLSAAGAGDYATIINKDNFGGQGCSLHLYNGQTLLGSLNGSQFEGATVPLNQWSYVAMTWNGSNASLWLNGVETIAGTRPYTPATSTPLTLANAAGYFHGNMQMVSVYNRALSTSELQEDTKWLFLDYPNERFETTVQLDNGLLIPNGAGASKVLTSDASGNATWQTPTFGPTTWTAVGAITNVSQTTTVQYTVDALGYVHLAGAIASTGSITGGTTLFTLPSNARPVQDVYYDFIDEAVGDFSIQIIASTGAVTAISNVSSGLNYSFDGKIFPTF